MLVSHVTAHIYYTGPRVGLVIGMVVLGLVIASVIGFVAIFIYKK